MYFYAKTLTHRGLYRQIHAEALHRKCSLHTGTFTRESFYTHGQLSQSDIYFYTHNFCILLRIGALASVSFHAEVPSHAAAEAFKHRCFSTHNLSHTNTHTAHREAVTPKNFCTDTVSAQMLSHTHRAFTHRELMHTKHLPHTNELLDVGTFTHKSFLHTQASDASPAQENRTFPQFSDVLGSTHILFREWSPQEKPNRDFALHLESAGVSHGKGCSGASAQ